MLKMLRFPKPFRFALAISLLTAGTVTPPLAQAQTATVAPNLMIIFGNSRSMERKLDDVNSPDWTTATVRYFDDTNNDGLGTRWITYTDAPTSKFRIAKDALRQLIWDSRKNAYNPISNNINFGFATFRQTFGFEAVSANMETRDAFNIGFPKDAAIWAKTTQERQTYGAHAKNYAVSRWGEITYLGTQPNLGSVTGYTAPIEYPPTPSAALAPHKDKKVVDDTTARYVNLPDDRGIAGGMVSIFKHSAMTNNTTTIDTDGKTVYHYRTVTGIRTPAPSEDLRITWKLCSGNYVSSSNFFQTLYVGDNPYYSDFAIGLQGSWGNSWGPNGSIWGAYSQRYCPWLPDASGQPVGGNILAGQVWKKITSNEKGTGKMIHFTGIGIYNGQQRNNDYGWFTGWSGETTFMVNPNPFRDDSALDFILTVTKANYPTTPADPNHPQRRWNFEPAGGLGQKTNTNHMGVFLNLPEPSLGYRDQRSVLKSFMQPLSMDPSGLEYTPDSADIHNLDRHIIANDKGISASTNRWASNESPIFDSLLGSYAYYRSYKAADAASGFDSCRSNNILLFFDGRENARWKTVGSDMIYARPEKISARLYSDLGVKTYVVILSSKQGDIDDANKIATAGGTNQAYAVNDATSLFNAFKAVISAVAGEILTASPALPRSIPTGGSFAYAPSQETNPAAGHFYAYAVNNKGVVSSSSTWDAASLMTASKRQSALKTNASDNSIIPLTNLRGVDFGYTGGRADSQAATVVNYTIDPSYASTATTDVYLGGRKYGSFLGLFSEQSTAPILLSTPMDTAYYIDNNYITYMKNANGSRPKRVLFQNDDGFLYAIDANSGELAWGWMPRPFLNLIKTPSTFWQNGNMRGGIVAGEAHDGTSYASYVMGTAQSGAIHYALKLDSSGNPSKVVWLDQVSDAKSPAYQAPVISYLSSGSSVYPYSAYANYITVDSTTNVSTFVVREVTGTGSASSQSLGITQPVSSELFIDQSGGLGNFYFGDKGGTVRYMPTANTAATAIAGITTVGDHYDSSNKEVRYVGTYRWNSKNYIWSVGQTGITVFVYDTTSSSWKRLWESHVGGAGKWDISCNCTTRTADNTGTRASSTGIQSLPSNMSITARPTVEKGALIVPIGQGNTTASCSSGDGYYYFFNLEDGFFPTKRFQVVKTDGTTADLTDNLYVGKGKPKRPAISTSGNGKFIFATAEQPGASGERMPALKVDLPTGNVISWREVIAR